MAAHSILIRNLRTTRHSIFTLTVHPRYLTTDGKKSPAKPGSPLTNPPSSIKQESWLTQKVRSSPTALKVFLKVANALGYGNPQQVTARRALVLYQEVCAVRADEESAFWTTECHLPPTFQSWFTITNLHIWLLTVRLRALPNPHGPRFTQALIDHFFLDVEGRIRGVLQPGLVAPDPNAVQTTFYSVQKAIESRTENGKPNGSAPERLVTQQMKIFREQWAGMGMALDLGLVRGDAEMAGAVWRNLLGARGAKGIVVPSQQSSEDGAKSQFRRNINPGGDIEKFSKMEPEKLEAEEAKDDGSGVHDFGPSETDQYVRYPETMVTLVSYLRRELVRLEKLDDEVILGSLKMGTEYQGVSRMRFGPVKDND